MGHPGVEHADPAHVAEVVRAARDADAGPGGVVVVAIDGRSGAGKSLLASEVGAELGAEVVRMDALYPGWDGLADGVELLVRHVLEPLARGEQAEVPTWSWVRDHPGPVRAVPRSAVVVVEGVGALAGRAPEFEQVRVWVDADDALRKERALTRDGETYAPHWDRWAAQEAELLARWAPREQADVVIRTDP